MDLQANSRVHRPAILAPTGFLLEAWPPVPSRGWSGPGRAGQNEDFSQAEFQATKEHYQSTTDTFYTWIFQLCDTLMPLGHSQGVITCGTFHPSVWRTSFTSPQTARGTRGMTGPLGEESLWSPSHQSAPKGRRHAVFTSPIQAVVDAQGG